MPTNPTCPHRATTPAKTGEPGIPKQTRSSPAKGLGAALYRFYAQENQVIDLLRKAAGQTNNQLLRYWIKHLFDVFDESSGQTHFPSFDKFVWGAPQSMEDFNQPEPAPDSKDSHRFDHALYRLAVAWIGARRRIEEPAADFFAVTEATDLFCNDVETQTARLDALHLSVNQN